MDFSSHEQRTGGARIPRPAGALHHRTRASRSNGPTYKVGERADQILHRRQAETGPRAPLLHDLAHDQDVPAAKIACTLETSAGEATVEHRRSRCPSTRRRSTKKPKNSKKKNAKKPKKKRKAKTKARRRALGLRRDQQLRPLRHPFADLVQRRVGRRARHPRRVERPAHRHRVLGAEVRVAARPPRPRGWAGSPASGRGPARRPRSASSSPACRCRGSRRRSRAPRGRSHSLRVQRPAKAKGSPPSTWKRQGWRGCLGSSAFIHS